MSDSLSITTVAEGIEDASQAQRMLELGCTYGQGYFFSRPVSDAEVAKIVGDEIERSLETTDRRSTAPRSVRLPRAAASIDASPA